MTIADCSFRTSLFENSPILNLCKDDLTPVDVQDPTSVAALALKDDLDPIPGNFHLKIELKPSTIPFSDAAHDRVRKSRLKSINLKKEIEL